MLITRLVLLCALILIVTIPLFAQEPFSWIGQKVVIKYDYPLKVRAHVAPKHGFHVYTVQRTNGDRLWVVSGSVEDWIPASQVVLFDQAINFYTQEIRANPGDSGAWHMRGVIWNEKKEYDIAIADYNEAIRLNPANSNSYQARGNAWQAKKDYDKAIADYNEAIRLEPNDGSGYRGRGWTWSQKKEYDKAIADYSEAIRLDPKDGSAYRGRGWVWSEKQEYDKAIADYNEAIRLDPKDAIVLLQPGQRLAQARRSTTRRSPTSTRPSDSIRRIAPAYRQPGRTPGTTRRTTTRPSPTTTRPSDSIQRTPTPITYRGIAWGNKKEYDKAIADLQRGHPARSQGCHSP